MSPDRLELRITTPSAAATRRVAAALAQELTPPVTLALHGDLGAGKTTFVQGLVAALPGGADVRVQSPTFALARTYPTQPAVHHLDLYRLEDEAVAHDLGLGELMTDPDAIACVEWPNRAPGLLPARRVDLVFEGSARRRSIELSVGADVLRAPERLASVLKNAVASPATRKKS